MAKVGFGWWYKVLGFSCVVAMQADDVLKYEITIINNARLCVSKTTLLLSYILSRKLHKLC